MSRIQPSSSTLNRGNETEFRFSDFELLSTIARGSFGWVMLCKNKEEKYFSIKIMSISTMASRGDSKHILDEKSLLKEINHHFVIDLLWTFKDEKLLYMLMPFCPGGDLFFHLRRKVKFDSETSLFFACEVVSAFEYLHNLSIIFRNLKPENILIDTQGHVKLTDFGMVKKLISAVGRTYTLCGTPEYLAPEIITGQGQNKAVDWWSLGILIFEMLAGYTPFYSEDPMDTYKKVIKGHINWPMSIDPVAKDLIKKLLVAKPYGRLSRSQEVKDHRWFKAIVWRDVDQRKLVPPIVPKVKFEGDVSNYDEFSDEDWRHATIPSADEKSMFDGF